MAFKFKLGQKVNVRLKEDANQMFEGEVVAVDKTSFTLEKNGEEKKFDFADIIRGK